MDPATRRLAAVFVVGLIALLSPVMIAFDDPTGVGGLPLLPLYLYGVWALLVGAAWLVMREKGP